MAEGAGEVGGCWASIASGMSSANCRTGVSEEAVCAIVTASEET